MQSLLEENKECFCLFKHGECSTSQFLKVVHRYLLFYSIKGSEFPLHHLNTFFFYSEKNCSKRNQYHLWKAVFVMIEATSSKSSIIFSIEKQTTHPNQIEDTR